MIKILHIMDNIAVCSGVSSVVMNIYRNIDRRLIQFDFLVSNCVDVSYEDEIKEYGGNIYYTGNPLSYKSFISTCINNKFFFINNGLKYEAVHLHSPTIADMTIRYAKKYNVKNIIIHSHSTMFSNNPIKAIINMYLRRNITKYANRYFACSTEAAEFLYGKKFCRTHIVEIIKNGVDTSKYAFDAESKKNILNEWNWNGNIVVLHVSNFSPIKNLPFIVQIIESVVKKRKDIRFLFIGDGKTKNSIEISIHNKNLQGYCKFLGSTNKVNYFLSAADILVLPSIKEGLPVSVVEAQANGIQCLVSSNITREVDAGNVKFIQLNNQEWANMICEYKPLSEEERVKKCINFEESCFNIKKEVKKLEKIYLEIKYNKKIVT